MEQHKDWKWWAGSNEEIFTSGPHDTRDEAIQDALGNEYFNVFVDATGARNAGIHIVEAYIAPLRIADWIGADDIVERAENRISDGMVFAENDEGPWFETTVEQAEDLEQCLRKAANDWQDRHKLVFATTTFEGQRNSEYLVLPHPNGADA